VCVCFFFGWAKGAVERGVACVLPCVQSLPSRPNTKPGCYPKNVQALFWVGCARLCVCVGMWCVRSKNKQGRRVATLRHEKTQAAKQARAHSNSTARPTSHSRWSHAASKKQAQRM